MKSELIQHLTDNFEAHVQQAGSGVEFWLARDIQHLLGYAEWRNFMTVISKAKVACEVSGQCIANHFVDVNKMVQLGSGSQREVDDMMLTRYACYLPKRIKWIVSLKSHMSISPTIKPCVRHCLSGAFALNHCHQLKI